MCYSVNSLFCLILFCLSFYNKKYSNLIFYGMLLTQIRNLVRLLDLENTRSVFTQERWIQLLFNNLFGCLLNTVLFHHSFNFTKPKMIMLNIFNSTLVLSFMMMGSLDNISDFKTEKISSFAGAVFFGIITF
jgi:hypothetical protein